MCRHRDGREKKDALKDWQKEWKKDALKARLQVKAEIIKAMHANGMTAEAIAAAIGFDLAEVEEILSQQPLS